MNTEQYFALYIAHNRNMFPYQDLPLMKQKVEQQGLPLVPLKSPIVAFLLALFLGGLAIDKFYLGQWELGLLKLCTGSGCGIWWFLDLFHIISITKTINYKNFMKA